MTITAPVSVSGFRARSPMGTSAGAMDDRRDFRVSTESDIGAVE
jgi:hypothetical protein